MGFWWPQDRRARNQEVPMCLMEVKHALNTDIANVHAQLERYHHAVEPRATEMAEEAEAVFHQKIDLGLYDRSPRRDALRTLRVSRDFAKFQFVLVLVDYNRRSTLFDSRRLMQLPFASQVRLFDGGFAMWQQNMRPLSGAGPG